MCTHNLLPKIALCEDNIRQLEVDVKMRKFPALFDGYLIYSHSGDF